MDSEAILQHLFTRIPCELFHSPTLAFEFVRFCGDSLPLFGRNLDILKQSFPNLFKARSVVLGPVGGGGYSAPPARPPDWHQSLASGEGPGMPAMGQPGGSMRPVGTASLPGRTPG